MTECLPDTGPFASKLLQKCMGYIIEYVKHGTLDESTTMTHIVQVIQAAVHSAMDLGDANPSRVDTFIYP